MVYPRQEPGANPQRCWNWFLPEHQERDAGETGAIATATRQIVTGGSAQAIDARRVFVAGLSSGGAMAAILAFTAPELFAAVAYWGSYRSAVTMPAAFSAMARGRGPDMLGPAAHAAMGDRARPVPGMVIHGDVDPTVAPVNADQLLGQLMHANRLAAPDGPAHDPDRPSERIRGTVDGGRAFTRSLWTDPEGTVVHERLIVHGMGHAWSGGLAGGSYTIRRARTRPRRSGGSSPPTALAPDRARFAVPRAWASGWAPGRASGCSPGVGPDAQGVPRASGGSI